MTRRKWIEASLGTLAGASGLAAAAKVADRYGLIPPDSGGLYGPGETLTYASQRLLTRHSLAREFRREQISQAPFCNTASWQKQLLEQLNQFSFADWRLSIDGMVAKPASYSIADLKSHTSRNQITQLICEEGWSYIAEWTGASLADVLDRAGVSPQAKYVLYSSFEQGWTDSIDMSDALHPQTLLTYGMNGRDLPVGFGGPLRMRVPRQLGYKSVKWINRITITDDRKKLGAQFPYAWYAGI